MKRADFEAQHGKLGPNVLYIDLVEHRTVEQTTAGWTDTQIRNYSMSDLDSQILQADLALEQMRKTLADQEQRKTDLLAVKRRKLELGGG